MSRVTILIYPSDNLWFQCRLSFSYGAPFFDWMQAFFKYIIHSYQIIHRTIKCSTLSESGESKVHTKLFWIVVKCSGLHWFRWIYMTFLTVNNYRIHNILSIATHSKTIWKPKVFFLENILIKSFMNATWIYIAYQIFIIWRPKLNLHRSRTIYWK